MLLRCPVFQLKTLRSPQIASIPQNQKFTFVEPFLPNCESSNYRCILFLVLTDAVHFRNLQHIKAPADVWVTYFAFVLRIVCEYPHIFSCSIAPKTPDFLFENCFNQNSILEMPSCDQNWTVLSQFREQSCAKCYLNTRTGTPEKNI